MKAEIELKMERGVKIPKHLKAGGPPLKYPFHKMKVGDSFFLKEDNAKKIRAAACNAGHRLQAKFTTRSIDGGIRVWRIK